MTLVCRMHTFYISIVVFACRLMVSVTMGTSFRTGQRPEVAPFRSLPNVSFGECRNECMSRPRCRSVGYRRHVAVCMLYEQDSAGIGRVVDPKVTYSEKKEWSLTTLSLSCSDTCKQTEVCRVLGGNPASCSTEECGAPVYMGAESQRRGNMRGVGNMVISSCSRSLVHRECTEEGKWLRVYPNYHTSSSTIEYMGCFVDRPGRILKGSYKPSSCLTVTYCAEYCFTRNFKYFGLEYRYQCFCGNVIHDRLTSNMCNTPCSGNRDEMCGGPWALNVYTYKVDIPT